jgi:hypothetical protein
LLHAFLLIQAGAVVMPLFPAFIHLQRTECTQNINTSGNFFPSIGRLRLCDSHLLQSGSLTQHHRFETYCITDYACRMCTFTLFLASRAVSAASIGSADLCFKSQHEARILFLGSDCSRWTMSNISTLALRTRELVFNFLWSDALCLQM